ncbi:hypothetical protein G6F57_018656 [Rhizopus arrhizus]|nr:hypothetical protein G6F65_023329 [Rhizopus arrhizus]KAG1441633.1 hypothetical protein G6F57_018656 [Rhizopus arrhizus]
MDNVDVPASAGIVGSLEQGRAKPCHPCRGKPRFTGGRRQRTPESAGLQAARRRLDLDPAGGPPITRSRRHFRHARARRLVPPLHLPRSYARNC